MIAVGLLGGTFDPIHIGHLRVAIESRDCLGLDEVRLLPAAIPPLKAMPGVSTQHRLHMVELATEKTPGLVVDARELQRTGPSYTVDTLGSIRGELGEHASITFLMGADSLDQLNRWSRWETLLSLVNIAVLQRPGFGAVNNPVVSAWLARHLTDLDKLRHERHGHVALIDQPPLAVSSTEIRQGLARKKNMQFLLPEPVIEYILHYELYSH